MPIIDEIVGVLGEWGVIGASTVGGIILSDLAGEALKSASGQKDWAGVGVEGVPKVLLTTGFALGGKRMPAGLGKNIANGLGVGAIASWFQDMITQAFKKPTAISAMSVGDVVGTRLGYSIRSMILGSHKLAATTNAQLSRQITPQTASKAERGVLEVPLPRAPFGVEIVR